MPANPPIKVTLQRVSDADEADGSQTAYYCMSNHTDKEVVFLADERKSVYYSLVEYKPGDVDPDIIVTNHNLANFFHARQADLPAGAGITFPVHIPAGVTHADLYINYMRQKGDWEESVQGLVRDITTATVGQVTSSGNSEPYQNYPLPQPFVKRAGK
jgi:hypothetical protein